MCVCVSFQEALPLAPNILQLCHLNDSISIGHLCAYHGYGGQDVQGRDKAFLSASLSYLLFSLSSRCYNAHTEISLQPPLHSSFYSLLDIFSSCTVSYSLIPSLVLALFPHLLHSLLLSLTAYSIQKNLLQKSFTKASLIILLLRICKLSPVFEVLCVH